MDIQMPVMDGCAAAEAMLDRKEANHEEADSRDEHSSFGRYRSAGFRLPKTSGAVSNAFSAEVFKEPLDVSGTI